MALFAVLLIAFAFLSSTYATEEIDSFDAPGTVVVVDGTKHPQSTHVDTLLSTCNGANGIVNTVFNVAHHH